MNSSLKNALVILSVLAVTFCYALWQARRPSRLYGSDAPPLMLEMLPSFELESVSGEKLTMENVHADGIQLLVVHFWGTWCPPCVPEFPQLLQFAERFTGDDRVKFLLVAVRDKREDVEKFVEKFGNLPQNIRLVLDREGTAMTSFGTVKVPETHYYLERRSAQRLIGPPKMAECLLFSRIKKTFALNCKVFSH